MVGGGSSLWLSMGAAARGGVEEKKLIDQTKRKRKPAGTPQPGSKVIALSPMGLATTKKVFCGVCNKGFLRPQNLELHKKGHNLPYTLKRDRTDDVGKKVYVCPESTCVHHDPSRALGDLTAVKKHYSRKHGEKRWNCDRCHKKYGLESDLKAHTKICGTKQYTCECNTIFARLDSFNSHRVVCNTLARERTVRKYLYGLNNNGMASQVAASHISSFRDLNPMLKIQNSTGTSTFEHLLTPSSASVLSMQSAGTNNMHSNGEYHPLDYSWNFGSPYMSRPLPQQPTQLVSAASSFHSKKLNEFICSSSSSTGYKPYNFTFPGGDIDIHARQGFMDSVNSSSSRNIIGGDNHQNGSVGSNGSLGNLVGEALQANKSAGIGDTNN